MQRKSEDRLLGRLDRILALASEVEEAAEELATTPADAKGWRRQRRNALLRAAVRYGVAVQRYIRRPPPRRKKD